MRNIVLLLTFIMFGNSAFYSQVIPNKNKVDDAFEELDNNLTLRFFNALNGEPIPGASVTVGDIGEFSTDSEGKAMFPADNLTNETIKVAFSHPKFIYSEFNIEIMAGTIFFNRFSVSPKLPIGSIRIVLDWDKNPADLDAHFVKSGVYHVSYRVKSLSDDGAAKLDRDDMNGYGPETITANRISENNEYVYYVHDYSNQSASGSSSLSNSKACVKVYGNEQLLYVFQIPEDMRGTKWNIFKIVNGKVIEINEITN